MIAYARPAMPRIGVISDTHGLVRPEALRALAGADLIVHAGDVGAPEVLDALRAVAPVVAVRGNNDRGRWARTLAETEVIERGGRALYVLHDLHELDLDPRVAGFDAVITDILMPRMDGYRLSYEVRRSEELLDTRIIVYSSSYASPADKRLALKAGADRFVRKPLDADVILRALKDVTRPRKPAEVVAPAAEFAVVKEYSEGLVRRLEDSNLRLGASRKRLAGVNEALRKSERWVRLLLDSTAEGIYGLDPAGNFTFCNAAALAMLAHAAGMSLNQWIAQRIVRFAKLLGKENVIAGSDCGFAQAAGVQRVHSSIMWAKLKALAQGAKIASEELFGGRKSEVGRPECASAALRRMPKLEFVGGRRPPLQRRRKGAIFRLHQPGG